MNQLEASTKTDTGPLWMETDKSSQLDFISVYPDILKLPPVFLHVWAIPL